VQRTQQRRSSKIILAHSLIRFRFASRCSLMGSAVGDNDETAFIRFTLLLIFHWSCDVYGIVRSRPTGDSANRAPRLAIIERVSWGLPLRARTPALAMPRAYQRRRDGRRSACDPGRQRGRRADRKDRTSLSAMTLEGSLAITDT
jgi:hypothetical protein